MVQKEKTDRFFFF